MICPGLVRKRTVGTRLNSALLQVVDVPSTTGTIVPALGQKWARQRAESAWLVPRNLIPPANVGLQAGILALCAAGRGRVLPVGS